MKVLIIRGYKSCEFIKETVIIGNKKDKKTLINKLKYPISKYPKFDNKNYLTDTNIQTQGLLI